LKANHVSKKSLSDIARKLGFMEHIVYDKNKENETNLLEDVFEAFFGFTVHLLDENYMYGIGHGIVYDILASIFDDIDVSLEYNDLYDAKTRLKELFDRHRTKLGNFKHKIHMNDDSLNNKLTIYYHTYNGGFIIVGKCENEHIKGERVRKASEQALDFFHEQGFENDTNSLRLFCDSLRTRPRTTQRR
jgi:dsRNA-specific ribonuclease